MWWLAPAFADDIGASAALSATGGVGAAAELENAAITLNPGLLGLSDRYDFQLQGGWGPEAGASWGGSLVDARTSPVVAGGFAYSGSVAEPPITAADMPGWITPGTDVENHKRQHDFALALARPLADNRVSLGLAANVGYYQHDVQGAGWLFDLDAGFAATPVRDFVIGVAGRNFLPVGREDRPLEAVGGLRYAPDVVAIEADASWREGTTQGLPITLAAGVDATLQRAFHLRGGWRRDATATALEPAGTQLATLGFGVHGGTGGFDFGAALPVSGRVAWQRATLFASVRVVGGPDISEPK